MGTLRTRLASLCPWALVALLQLACVSQRPLAPAPADGQAPARLVDLDGVEHDLEGALAAGRRVVLVFWQTWCGSCLREAPAIAAAARAYPEELLFLGVVPGSDADVDERELRRVAAELRLPYAQVRDRDGSLARRLAVRGTPTLIAFGEGGAELFRGHSAPSDWGLLVGGRTQTAAWFQDPAPLLLAKRELGVMGTELLLEALGPDLERLELALDAAEAELRRVEDLMTDWRPSPLMELNAAAGTGPVRVDPEIARLVARGLEISRLTGGAFDMTYASVGTLWDFKRRPPKVPTPEEVRAALEFVGWERVEVDLAASTIALPAGFRLGLGGIAKGYGVDRAMAVLMEHGVQHGMVNAGGDLKALGKKHGAPWRIAVRHPRDRERALAVLPVSNLCVVTSGDYDRFFEHGGRRYHHILDPRTGFPSTGCISATVVAPDAAFADALATAMCVLGPAAGLPIVESLPRVEALLVDLEGEVHASSGLAKLAGAKDASDS